MHAYQACISCMNIVHADHACISCMHIMHAYHACKSLMHIMHALYQCISCMHIMHAYHACMDEWIHNMYVGKIEERDHRENGRRLGRPRRQPETNLRRKFVDRRQMDTVMVQRSIKHRGKLRRIWITRNCPTIPPERPDSEKATQNISFPWNSWFLAPWWEPWAHKNLSKTNFLENPVRTDRSAIKRYTD